MKLFKELLDGNTEDGVKPSKCIEHKTHDEVITSAGAKAHEVWKKTSSFWKQYLVSEPNDPAVETVCYIKPSNRQTARDGKPKIIPVIFGESRMATLEIAKSNRGLERCAKCNSVNLNCGCV